MIRNTWEKIQERIDKTGDHWIWTGVQTHDGYGIVVINNRKWRIHRYVYTVLVGPIPDGHDIDHIQDDGLCGVRLCCKPEHLRPLSHRENIAASTNHVAAKMLQTHCIHGHEFTEKNTKIRKNGTRECRRCKNLRAAVARAEKRDAAA